MGIFNADVIINIPPAFFSLQKSGLVRVYLTSVFLLLSVPRCFGDQKPQFDSYSITFLFATLSLSIAVKSSYDFLNIIYIINTDYYFILLIKILIFYDFRRGT